MKRILLLFILLITTAQTIQSQTVVLDTNGVTVKWTGTTVPSPYFVQANPRGTGMEWFAIVDNSTKNNINDYARNIPSGITFFTPPTGTAPIPFNNIVTTLVTNMTQLFYLASSFNQPISSWDVSNVNYMEAMFQSATIFNQPIDSWKVNNVINMGGMFNSSSFNQPIGSWNVSNVTYMAFMFAYTTAFNQPIGSWNVSNVTKMHGMFYAANAFNQPINNWNVGNVTNMRDMFQSATSFNQPIGSWNVSNVTDMGYMFRFANAFNQTIGSWNVSNVNDMDNMFGGIRLSTSNYDALLIGWATISPNETPLKPNVVFSGGNSNYCNGANARSAITSTYGWTITDAGLNCVLDTGEFETNTLKLYPNPVISVLNIKTDSHLINQTYTIIDCLGRIVLNGKLNEVDTTINVEQLSKGIYYIKTAGNSATKFIKE